MKIEFQAIGVIHTPFKKPEGVPIQLAGAARVISAMSRDTQRQGAHLSMLSPDESRNQAFQLRDR
jgi:hypothetical protein